MKNNIKRGFTLVELLVVMTILAVLSFLAVPQFVKMQKQANVRTFEANHRMIVSALTMYAADKDGKFPVASTWNADLGKYLKDKNGGATLSAANKGLGQAGANFTYTLNSSSIPKITSTLSAAYTPDGALKTISYTVQ